MQVGKGRRKGEGHKPASKTATTGAVRPCNLVIVIEWRSSVEKLTKMYIICIDRHGEGDREYR